MVAPLANALICPKIPLTQPRKRLAMEPDCPFCDRIVSSESVASNEHAVAIPDAFPLSFGHTLIVPRRHVSSLWDLSESELENIWKLAGEVRKMLGAEHSPDGFNVGVNDGAAAGQTMDHAHLHVIPRYERDVPDPRGGIRHVLPERARYWSE